jgi:hypothetical protein
MNKPIGDLRPEVEVTSEPLAKLRAPFPAHQISKKPAPTKAQTEAVKADFKKGIRCQECGSWHHPDVVHLDYVGHASATNRLLDADPRWNWEPVADPAALGLPVVPGGMWIRLTVDGVSRLGFGSADGKSGGDAVKEVIGDAIRNAGMRFGMALDLWHKGDLHAADPEEPAPSLEERAIGHLRTCAAVGKEQFSDAWKANFEGWKKTLDRDAYTRVNAEMKRLAAAFPKEEPKPEPQAAGADDLGIGDDDLPEQFK